MHHVHAERRKSLGISALSEMLYEWRLVDCAAKCLVVAKGLDFNWGSKYHHLQASNTMSVTKVAQFLSSFVVFSLAQLSSSVLKTCLHPQHLSECHLMAIPYTLRHV